MGKKKIQKEEIYLLLFTLALLAVNAVRIFNDSISGDEGFSLMLIQMDSPSMLAATAADVHPPLYYLMYQVFALFGGYSAAAGRVFSFAAIVVTAVLANTYLKKRFGVCAAAVFFALLTFTKNCIEMIVEIRMYTWSMLFVTLTALFAYELLRETKRYKWVGLFVFGLAAAYTHYYALIMVAFVYLFVFAVLIMKDRKHIKACVLCAAAAAVGYFPWLLILIKQFGAVSESYWIGGIDVKECIRYVFGAGRIGQLLRVTLVLSAAIYLFTKDGLVITHSLREKDKAYMRFDWRKPCSFDADRLFVLLCGVTAVGTIAVGVIVSYLVRPLYVERYLYSAMGLVCLAFGIAFTRCSKKKLYTWILLAYLVVFGLRHFASVSAMERAYQTEDSKAFFTEQMQDGDVVITNDAQLSWTVLSYYFPEHTVSHIGNYDLLEQDYTTAWYMNTGKELDPRIPEYEEKGLKVTYVMDCGIGRYPYALYKITK